MFTAAFCCQTSVDQGLSIASEVLKLPPLTAVSFLPLNSFVRFHLFNIPFFCSAQCSHTDP